MILCHPTLGCFEEIKGCYELDIDLVTIFYVVDGEHVMIQVVDWRIL
jgi:hypothetical protein